MNPTAASDPDVLVMGGGLAGLTLALQLRRRLPDLRILVLERRSHPVPESCHKIGESSVEIGAHYFEQVLGLGDHLRSAQLKKFGFRFFFSHCRDDIAGVTELGASRPLAVGSWQIDRGIFENFLGAEVQRRGIEFVDEAIIRRITLATDKASPHEVHWQRAGAPPRTTRARWVIDACGRAGLLKRQLGLARPAAHAAHAVWFRVGARIRIDDWSDDPAWRARCATPTRWLSTNHLVGPGYWVWLIPLASGSHSVGIVADPRWHALETMDSFERAMDWLAVNQPRLHRALDPLRERLQDFAFLRRFTCDCEHLLSADRWALAGEAGRFLDPFYSPGSDFIAIVNTYITDLVARDRAGLALAAHTQIYDQILRSFYDSTLALYRDQYGIFGDPEVLPVKVVWDYSYYWSVLAPLFFQGRLTDLRALAQLRDELATCRQLNDAVQVYLRHWSERSARRNPPRMLDQAAVPWFAELNRSLQDRLDDNAFVEALRAATRRLRALATEILARGGVEHAALAGGELAAAIEAGGGPLDAGFAMLFPAPAPSTSPLPAPA
ncbi:MAG: NAD(P)-binding protein [Burkholderiales bacterium]|nr:NAD(P)-binding protein [Burkholderiales bacterium]MDE1929543.1 NAD(P)-binding protein [Burkholderiales bacterium]